MEISASDKICSSRAGGKLLIVEPRLKRRSWNLKKRKMIWPKKALMKRRKGPRSLIRRPKHCNSVDRKVKTLKELVPNRSEDLDELFKQTADYIFNLQKKVQLLQNMVNMLCQAD